MNVTAGWILILIGVICWVLLALGVALPVDLWVIGWAFVVSGALLFNGPTLRT